MGIKGALAFAAAALFGAALIDATWTPPQIGMGWQARALHAGNVPNVATPNVPVWDIDPEQLNSASDIATLMGALKDHNRYVICYVNVGSLDTGANDAGSFPKSIIGNAYPDWPGEYFLDIRSSVTRSLIKARFERMASYGCDGIEPDNLDTYTEKTFAPNKPDLTLTDALDYMNWISTTVHDLGMAIGLKNGGDLVKAHDLASVFDFAIVESCAEFSGDCAEYAPFIQAGKPVFAAEYTTKGDGGCPVIKSADSACAATNAANFEGIIKTCDLGAEWKGCQTYDDNGYRAGATAAPQIANELSSTAPLTNADANGFSNTSPDACSDACSHATADACSHATADAFANATADAFANAVRRPSTKSSTWSRRFATSSRDQAATLSSGSNNSGALAGSSTTIMTAAVGAVIGIIGTMLAFQVWIRRRDARAKQTLYNTAQLAAV
ncbi:hypothetical protein PBRA_008659 [Plasmodiophora brassicae]|uniref:Glycoside-hydrolase family GH114 TIM-barrel domain-containing protein n=1 Tax=Plasmodiophora brassicae TaxID=37360 RepID=A0A0G4J2J4_PLABS|nr:hypothetical protein PBRA_008659 [Plasmodiophora brassicae]